MAEDKSVRGLAVMREMLGSEAAEAMQESIAAGGFGSPLAALAVDYAFADVWARDGLDRRSRSLVTIAILIAQRQPSELRNHVRIGLANGLSPREIEEALIQAAPYVGFPAVATAMSAIIDALRDAGLNEGSLKPQERGLL